MQREAPIDSPDVPDAVSSGEGHRRLPGFDALKVFCDVARCRSISQAAADNDLSQPAASLIVRQLEKRLGVQLVNRLKRPVQLTALGQLYYHGCKGLVEQYLELEASIRSARADRGASIQVAAIYSVGLGDMGSFVERFERLHPCAKVHVEYLPPDQVYERVHEGIADFGLVSFPRKLRELAVEPWREEEMVLACAGPPASGAGVGRAGAAGGRALRCVRQGADDPPRGGPLPQGAGRGRGGGGRVRHH